MREIDYLKDYVQKIVTEKTKEIEERKEAEAWFSQYAKDHNAQKLDDTPEVSEYVMGLARENQRLLKQAEAEKEYFQERYLKK